VELPRAEPNWRSRQDLISRKHHAPAGGATEGGAQPRGRRGSGSGEIVPLDHLDASDGVKIRLLAAAFGQASNIGPDVVLAKYKDQTNQMNLGRTTNRYCRL